MQAFIMKRFEFILTIGKAPFTNSFLTLPSYFLLWPQNKVYALSRPCV